MMCIWIVMTICDDTGVARERGVAIAYGVMIYQRAGKEAKDVVTQSVRMLKRLVASRHTAIVAIHVDSKSSEELQEAMRSYVHENRNKIVSIRGKR